MAFSGTWNAAFEAIPANEDDASEGALRIRNLKRDIRERLEIDHVMDETADDGKHTKVTMPVLVVAPTQIASTGILYTKDVASKAELFYRDEDGNEVQLTTGGAVGNLPVGTSMLFFQAAAPVGWTKSVTNNNKALRVVSGSGGGTGGSVGFTTAFSSTRTTTTDGDHLHTDTTTSAGGHTHTATTALGGQHGHIVAVDDHALTGAEVPTHKHSIGGTGSTTGGGSDPGSSSSAWNSAASTNQNTNNEIFTGGVGDGHSHVANTNQSVTHSHTLTTTSDGAHTHGVTTNTTGDHAHTSNLDVQFLDVIVCTKD